MASSTIDGAFADLLFLGVVPRCAVRTPVLERAGVALADLG
ncbi:MAG TPA: hypothetical protein VFQ96_05675 [Microbacteriaceae bacterium]|nr:hypothetical protein [Microbacteriaceae bacterium]